MHDARILPFLGVSFGCCGRGEGRGGARGAGAAHAACARPPLCARRRGAFAGSSHAALSCPRSRARCSCCCACSRVRRARCPLLREARTFRGALCEVSAFASRRWVLPLAFHAPSLPCAFVPRRRALLNWLALCMRVTPTAPLPRLCCGRSDGIGGGATSPRRCIYPPRRLRAASSRPRLHHPVHITAETAVACRLPQKTWRCDGVSLNCHCSAVLF